MAAESRGGAKVTLVHENDGASKSFELPSGEERRIRMGRAKENDFPIDQKGASWFHCELRLLAPELRGNSGAMVKLRDTSTNGVGLKAPGTSTIRLTKGSDHPVPDGSLIIIPFKVKAEDGKSPDELRASVKVMVASIGDPGLSAPPGNWGVAAAAMELEPPPLPQAPSAEPRPKAVAPLPPKAATPKSSANAARAKAAAPKSLPKPKAEEPPKAAAPKSLPKPKAEEPPKAALAKSNSRPPVREVEEDFPPAIPAATGVPPAPEVSEKPKERRRRDGSRSRRDREKDRSRGRRRERGERERERRASEDRSRDVSRRSRDREPRHAPPLAAKEDPGLTSTATGHPSPPAPPAPPPPPSPEVQDGTAKRFEEMMKRVKAFAQEKEKTYEERVAECRAKEEADKKKREEEEAKRKEEEEEAKRKEEMRNEEKRREETSQREKEKEKEKEAPSSPSKPPSTQAQSSLANQMMMTAMMMGGMNQMMGMGGMGMPGMGMGMPPGMGQMQGSQASIPKSAALQGMVAVKSGHPPPPGVPAAGDTSRDGIGAVTKSKSAGAPPPHPPMPGASMASGWPDMNLAAKAVSPPPPPPGGFGFDRPQGSGFNDRRHEPEGGDAKEDHRRSRGGFSDNPPERGHNGDRSRERSRERSRDRDRSRERSRDRGAYDGGRSHRSGGGGGGGGRLAEWQEKDIEDLCHTFNLDDRLRREVEDALAKRSDSFTQDLSSLKQTLESARNPPGLLKVKLREMEDGSFVAKGSKGKGKGGGKGKDKDGGKDGGKDRSKGPMMSASRRAELFGDESPRRSRDSRPKRSRRSRSRRRRSPKGDASGDDEPKEERKRLPRGSNFS